MNAELLNTIAPGMAVLGLAAIGGWIFTTWLRVKNGYPLENSWGKAVYPKSGDEAKAIVRETRVAIPEEPLAGGPERLATLLGRARGGGVGNAAARLPGKQLGRCRARSHRAHQGPARL